MNPRNRRSLLVLPSLSLLALLLAASASAALSTDRVANCFDTSEDIVVTLAGPAKVDGLADYRLTNYYGETIIGKAPVVREGDAWRMRIPAHFLLSTRYELTVAGTEDDGRLPLMIVPGVVRYSDHLVVPAWQHLTPVIAENPAGHAYFLLQIGMGGTNFGDTRYDTPSAAWTAFQRAMVAEGLYCQGKEGWRTPWPLAPERIDAWAQHLLDNGITRLALTLGNEPEEGGFWRHGAQAYYDYTNMAYPIIKARMPDALVGGPDAVIIRGPFYDAFLEQCKDSLDYFSFHQVAMGVDGGAVEGDVHTWVRKMRQHGVSRPMADGECMCGKMGGLENPGQRTYFHAFKLTNDAGLGASWPSLESALIGHYCRGVVRTDIFNPAYERQPLFNGQVPIRQPLGTIVVATRTCSDWLAGSFPLGRIDIADPLPQVPRLPRTEIWATKRGDAVGLWIWCNEDLSRPLEIRTPAQTLHVVDDQGNVRTAKVQDGVFRILADNIPAFVTGFPDIPQVAWAEFPNQAPQINSQPVTEAVVGGRYVYRVDGFDAENCYRYRRSAVARFTLPTAPSGMTIDTVGGRIAWTPTAAGEEPVVVRYTDPQGLSVEQSFTIKVVPADQNVGPYFVSNPVRVAPIGKEYFYTPRAIDPNGDALTFSLDEAPAGAAIDAATGRVTWTPTTSTDARFAIRASDGRGGAAVESFRVASGVIAIRTRGGWPNAAGDLRVQAGEDGTVTLNWVDNSGGDREEKGFVIERSSVRPPEDANARHGTASYNYIEPFTMVHVTDANVTTWTDTPPAPGEYWYRVKAVNHIADWEGYSNIGSASFAAGE